MIIFSMVEKNGSINLESAGVIYLSTLQGFKEVLPKGRDQIDWL